MNARTQSLAPNKTDISAHLYALFDPAFVQAYPDAWIEIAYGYAPTGGDVNAARHFSVFQLQEAAEFAEAKNMAGYNIYVGPAIRQGSRPAGRAKDNHVATAAFAWSEFDGEGDAGRIRSILKERDLAAGMIVTTGRVPHLRAHLYFRLAEVVTPETLRAANGALVACLGSDSVQNPSRVMRLAGTVNYPTPKKQADGYVAELVTLQPKPEARAFSAEELIGLSGKSSRLSDFLSIKPGRGDDELVALLEASKIKNWHNNMRDAIATMIGRGWSDSAIRLSSAPYCNNGATDPDLVPLIGGARAKWDRPNQEDALPTAEPKRQLPRLVTSAEFVEAFVPPDYAIDGLIQRRFLYSMTANTGHGKTGVALLVALLMATGSSLGHREIDKGRVLYFAGENPDDVRMRWIALCEKHGVEPKALDVHFLPGTGKLSEVAPLIKAEVAKIGEVSLIIIDTSIAYFDGDDENNNVQAVAHARRMREMLSLPGGPCVVVLCHPVKNAQKDNLLPRGGGSFLNEMDGNLTCWRDEDIVSLHWSGKFRGPDFEPIKFQLRPVKTGKIKDSKGRIVPTVIVQHLDAENESRLEKQMSDNEDALLMAMAKHPGASLAGLAVALGWLTSKGEDKSKVRRHAKKLAADKLVKTVRGKLVLTEFGSKEATRLATR
jgi:hypothetical protein